MQAHSRSSSTSLDDVPPLERAWLVDPDPFGGDPTIEEPGRADIGADALPSPAATVAEAKDRSDDESTRHDLRASIRGAITTPDDGAPSLRRRERILDFFDDGLDFICRKRDPTVPVVPPAAPGLPGHASWLTLPVQRSPRRGRVAILFVALGLLAAGALTTTLGFLASP